MALDPDPSRCIGSNSTTTSPEESYNIVRTRGRRTGQRYGTTHLNGSTSFKRSTESSLPYHGQIINIWEEYPLKEINRIVKNTKSRPSIFPILVPVRSRVSVFPLFRVVVDCRGDDVGRGKERGTVAFDQRRRCTRPLSDVPPPSSKTLLVSLPGCSLLPPEMPRLIGSVRSAASRFVRLEQTTHTTVRLSELTYDVLFVRSRAPTKRNWVKEHKT